MKEKRCYGCMRLKSDNTVCEYCGYDERTSNEQHQIPAGTVLKEQYLIGKVLGQGNGVVSGGGEAAQTACNQDPVGNRTNGKTDADPSLSKAESEDAAGQTHQQPGAHIRCLCAHCSDPRSHFTAAKEVILVRGALFLDEEEHADADHCYKVQHEGEKLKIQSKNLSFN